MKLTWGDIALLENNQYFQNGSTETVKPKCVWISIYFLKTCKQTAPACLFTIWIWIHDKFLKFINSQRGSHKFLLLLAPKRLWTQSRQKLLRVIFSKLNDFCVRNFAIIYIFKKHCIFLSRKIKAQFGYFQAKIKERADWEMPLKYIRPFTKFVWPPCSSRIERSNRSNKEHIWAERYKSNL